MLRWCKHTPLKVHNNYPVMEQHPSKNVPTCRLHIHFTAPSYVAFFMKKFIFPVFSRQLGFCREDVLLVLLE